MADEIDAKLARVGRRIQAQSDNAQARLEAMGDALVLAQACRETFGASLKYLKDAQGELGSSIDRQTGFDLMRPGVVGWTEYIKPKQRNRS